MRQELISWLRNDADKIDGAPGLIGVQERLRMAAAALERAWALHIGCPEDMCQTKDALTVDVERDSRRVEQEEW